MCMRVSPCNYCYEHNIVGKLQLFDLHGSVYPLSAPPSYLTHIVGGCHVSLWVCQPGDSETAPCTLTWQDVETVHTLIYGGGKRGEGVLH